MVLDNMCCDRRSCEELKSEIFNTGFDLTIDKQVCINDSMIDVCKTASCENMHMYQGDGRRQSTYLGRVCDFY